VDSLARLRRPSPVTAGASAGGCRLKMIATTSGVIGEVGSLERRIPRQGTRRETRRRRCLLDGVLAEWVCVCVEIIASGLGKVFVARLGV
jgi:hypothetical protein